MHIFRLRRGVSECRARVVEAGLIQCQIADRAQAEELVGLAERTGTVLQVGHIERFNPAYEELRSRTVNPKFVECERHGTFTGRSTDIGAVLDLMIHDLDLLLDLIGGPVVEIQALAATVFGGHEDLLHARLARGGHHRQNALRMAQSAVARQLAQEHRPAVRALQHPLLVPEIEIPPNGRFRRLDRADQVVERHDALRAQGLPPTQTLAREEQVSAGTVKHWLRKAREAGMGEES